MKVLRASQPLLCAKLEECVALRGHFFEHIETDAENGVWVEGLTQTPFFQSNAFPPLPWKNAKEAEGSVLFVYGAGAAPWLHVLLRSMPAGIISALVIEPSIDLLAYTLHTTSVYRLMPDGCRLFFASSPTATEVREALVHGVMSMGTYVVSRLGVYCHPGETALWPEGFAKLGAEIHAQLVIRLLQLGNSVEDTLLGMRQTALLSPWIALGTRLNTIRNTYKERPFICVASGPSLDKNFRLLKENRDRAVIICADTAASKLLKDGIIPHVVVALERGNAVHAYMEKLYARFPEEAKRILLVAQAVCVQEVAGKWPGPVAVVGKAELVLDSWLAGGVLGGDLLTSGLSVAHMGMWLAAYMGASSIALMGQDLAFAPGRVSHASDTVTGATAAAEATGEYRALGGFIQVPGALGGIVETHEIWRVFLSMIEDYVPHIGCPVFDCTEGGALIRGTKVAPLRDWMEEFLNAPGVESFAVSPAEAVVYEEPAAARMELASAAASRAMDELRRIAAAAEAIEKIAVDVGRVAAPALPQERRRKLADSVYRALDSFHREFPVMDFIGQGMGGANALSIAQNRRLADVPSIKAWEAALMDIAGVYRIVLRHIEAWLRYVAAAVSAAPRLWEEGYTLEALPFFPAGAVGDLNGLEKDLAVEMMEKALTKDAASPEEAFFMLDNLIARADHKWWHFWASPADWRVALLLEKQGRFAEASYFMARFERAELQVFGLPEEEEREFYRDYARMLSSHDFCRETDWAKVLAALDKSSAPKDALDAAMLGREKDAAREVKAAKIKGTLFFDYAPRYVVDEMSRLVEDAGRLAAAALYHKERFLDF